MPKRVGFLYDKMLDKDFIRETIVLAANHKHKRFDVKQVLRSLEYYVEKTYKVLLEESYTPTRPKNKKIWDTSSEKHRVIKIVPFWPDGVVQWLMVRVMQPVMLRGMYHWSCASLPGKGGQRVQKYTKRILEKDPYNTQYAEELDVKKFYPSVQIDIMMREVSRKIKDTKFLRLMRTILESASDDGKTGIAIGFYICQWLANYILECVDLFIKKLKGVKYYTRYMDNMNLYSYSKELLHMARILITAFLKTRLCLQVKETWQVFRTASRKIAAVGYRFARYLTILRKRNLLRIIRQCRRLQKKIDQRSCSKTVYNNYISTYNIEVLKEVVRNESKRQCDARRRLLDRAAA